MTIKDINFADYKRTLYKGVIGYKSDMNTPEVKGKCMYPMEDILADDIGEGFALYVKPPKNSYSSAVYKLYYRVGTIIELWLDTGAYIGEYAELEKIKMFIIAEKEKGTGTFEGYKEYIREKLKQDKLWIPKSELIPLAAAGERELLRECAEQRARVIKRREKEEAERKAECARKEEECRREKEKVFGEKKAEIINKIKNNGRIDNEYVCGENIIVNMVEAAGINIPLRTKGWMLDTQKFIYFRCEPNGMNVCYNKQICKKCSQKVFEILEEMRKYYTKWEGKDE